MENDVGNFPLTIFFKIALPLFMMGLFMVIVLRTSRVKRILATLAILLSMLSFGVALAIIDIQDSFDAKDAYTVMTDPAQSYRAAIWRRTVNAKLNVVSQSRITSDSLISYRKNIISYYDDNGIVQAAKTNITLTPPVKDLSSTDVRIIESSDVKKAYAIKTVYEVTYRDDNFLSHILIAGHASLLSTVNKNVIGLPHTEYVIHVPQGQKTRSNVKLQKLL